MYNGSTRNRNMHTETDRIRATGKLVRDSVEYRYRLALIENPPTKEDQDELSADLASDR